MSSTPNKEIIIALLHAHINSRAGMDWRDYGDVAAYRAESRRITQQRADALTMLRAVERSASITADDLLAAFKSAFSGRLSLSVTDGGRARLDYCTGQYYPTEYRAAACAVLALALRRFWGGYCLPAHGSARYREFKPHPRDMDQHTEHEYKRGNKWLTHGQYVRAIARDELGRGIQSRWID